MAMIWSTAQECGGDMFFTLFHRLNANLVKIQASTFIDLQADPKVHFKK